MVSIPFLTYTREVVKFEPHMTSMALVTVVSETIDHVYPLVWIHHIKLELYECISYLNTADHDEIQIQVQFNS